jgi:protoporphyrinogen oxidase
MRRAIIIGGGPAGLTAAYELLKNTDIKPIIIERSAYVGGLSKTVNYKDNLIDIGGHRFFSKSDRVINWWLDILPIEKESADQLNVIKYQNKEYGFKKGAVKDQSGTGDNVMLLRSRVSSIYHRNKFFSYPLTLSFETLKNLGLTRSLSIIISYIRSQLFPVKPEVTLEDFLINRFGKNLYKTFFKDYTEKVWGISPGNLPSEWGKQRIKGVSLKKVLVDALSKIFSSKKKKWDSSTETSLIEHFLYPKFGPGHLWEQVAAKVKAAGGEIHHQLTVTRINIQHKHITSVETKNQEGLTEVWEADYFFSSMPVKELINAFDKELVPQHILEISNGLLYRDFITVGLLVDSLKIKTKEGHLPKDNWIYIQDDTVKIGRLQIFNNWSPYMVKDLNKVWLGLEYFCNKGDELWNKTDAELIQFAIHELTKIGIIEKHAVTDSTILREEKAYPSYFGSYNQFSEIKNYLKEFANLYPIGRNGMHKYNNTDHSMLTAIASVENIISGFPDKESIWQINTEEDYHESKNE